MTGVIEQDKLLEKRIEKMLSEARETAHSKLVSEPLSTACLRLLDNEIPVIIEQFKDGKKTMIEIVQYCNGYKTASAAEIFRYLEHGTDYRWHFTSQQPVPEDRSV